MPNHDAHVDALSSLRDRFPLGTIEVPPLSERTLAEAVETMQRQIEENYAAVHINNEPWHFQGTESHRIQLDRPNTLGVQGMINTGYGMCKNCKLVHALIHRVEAECPKCGCGNVAIMFIGAMDNVKTEGGRLCP